MEATQKYFIIFYFLMKFCAIVLNLCIKLNSNPIAKFFSLLSALLLFVHEIMNIHPIDRYQNTIPRVVLLLELKKFQLLEPFKFMTYDSIYISPLSIANMLVF